MRTIVACFTVALIAVLTYMAVIVDDIDAKLTAALDAFGMFLWAVGIILVVTLVLLAIILIYLIWHKHRTKLRLPVDGAFPLQEYRLRKWRNDVPWPVAFWEYLRGEKMIVNINTMVASAAVIGPQGFTELTPAAGWDRQLTVRRDVEITNRVRAAFQGDESRNNVNGADSRPPSMGGAWRALNAQPPKNLALPEPEEETEAEFRPVEMGLDEALKASGPSRFLLGHNDRGDTVAFEPTMHHNIGIVGAQGTGKTAGSGYQVLLQALKSGFHPVILDPKGGVDLRPFAEHCEWRPTNAEAFGAQIAMIRQEHERRHQALIRHDAANVDELRSREFAHVLVFVEEYGALWEDIEASKKRKEVDAINTDIDTMMRLSRMTGIHWCFIDQFPEKWSPQVFMATKFRIVYQVAPGQDSFLREYKADQLPPRGVFMHRRQQWKNWDVKPQLRQLLAVTPKSTFPELTEHRPSVPKPVPNPVPSPVPVPLPVVDPPPPAAGNGNDDQERGHKWEAFARDWFANNPNGGPTALARAMWEADGRIKPHTDYKSEAARRLAALKQAQPVENNSGSVAEQLMALGVSLSDLRLPGGERFGVDITHGGDD